NLLRRNRERNAIGPGLPRTSEGAYGRAVRHGRGYGGADTGTRVRLSGGRTGGVSLPGLGGTKERPAGRFDRRPRRRTRRTRAHGRSLRSGGDILRSGACILRNRGHRDRNASTLVRCPRRPPLEAGVQRPAAGGSGGVGAPPGFKPKGPPHTPRV